MLKLEILVIELWILWRILVSLRGFFGRLYFCMVKYLSFINSSFALKILFNECKWQGCVQCDTPPLFNQGGLRALLCCSYGVFQNLQLWSASEWTSSLLLLMNKMTDGHVPHLRNSRIPCTCTPGACSVTSCRHPCLQPQPAASKPFIFFITVVSTLHATVL